MGAQPVALVLTEDPALLDELLRVTALAGVTPVVVPSPELARPAWDRAGIVLVGADRCPALTAAGVGRRPGVVVVTFDGDEAACFRHAVDIGAERVAVLPDAEPWLTETIAAAGESGTAAPVLAVLPGRGGAGASTTATALALSAARAGHSVALIDADHLGGGLDLLLGAEGTPGLRWPQLAGARGRIGAAALAGALPRPDGVSLLSFDRQEAEPPGAEAFSAVLTAAARGHDLVVVDLPRRFDPATRVVLRAAATVLVVVPAEVRAGVAAGAVAGELRSCCADVRLLVRGPAPTRLRGEDIAEAAKLPLAGAVAAERHLAAALDRGDPPGLRRAGPLARWCDRFLAGWLPAVNRPAVGA